MRKVFYTLIILVLFIACGKNKDKEQTFQAMGTLKSFDMGMCACCGGVTLEIDNDLNPYSVQKIANLSWSQVSQMTLPRRISFNYEMKSACAVYTLIEITDYELH